MRCPPSFKILSIAVLAAVVALLGVDASQILPPAGIRVRGLLREVTDSISVNGWVIRQETPLPETSGTLLRQVQEGGKGPRGQTRPWLTRQRGPGAGGSSWRTRS